MFVVSAFVVSLSTFITQLGAFTKLRKATRLVRLSDCLSVHPSVRNEQLYSHCKDFREIYI
jgi:hypothetical protein